ncbi:MAG: hypothetical protein JWM95_5004 [Gemmatimonadetes bacterium]|nr:hypothetical protein [Gemmatimonadota bacterium]
MQTLRHAAERLAAAHTVDGCVVLAAALGFDPVALPVDSAARERLGLPVSIADARIVRGHGALRALLVSAPHELSFRALVTQIASVLGARTSHVLWLVIGSAGDEVGVACWQSSARGPRVVALVSQPKRIVASDAEALCALAASSTGDDLLVHTRWYELLGREALSRRFYRTLEQRVRVLGDSLTGINATDRAELALLYVSRLLFLSFLESKGWLDSDHAFLARHFDECMASGGRFHQRVLLPLFFGTLNTPIRNRSAASRTFGSIPFLNGGLFSKSAPERRHSRARFSDDAFGELFGQLLGAYRFTAREGHDEWCEAAIDPEMLGRAFECLMAGRERRLSGTFFTPQSLVSHVADKALLLALRCEQISETDLLALFHGARLDDVRGNLLRVSLRTFTVLDPACGSGAFLVYMLERLAGLHRAAGDTRPLATIRREVLARTIHGVDLNPTAVWLCELRLWLSVVIESDETRMWAVPPLPNLDCNIRVGDTLAGEAFTEPPTLVGPPAVLVRLRERYVRATGPKKAPLRRALAREERKRAIAAMDRELAALTDERRERIRARRTADLFGKQPALERAERDRMRLHRLRAAALRRERRRVADGGALPFSFPSHFGAAHARNGFDLVIGNPPWVRLHNIPAAARNALRAKFMVYRDAAWEHGARGSSTSRGFAAQIDLAALFVERSVGLASPTGCVALLLPNKLWRSLAGGGVRRLLGARTHLHVVEDWSEAPSSFDAAVYPSVMIASRRCEPEAEVHISIRRRELDLEWSALPNSIALIPGDSASPWLLLPPHVRTAFDRIVSHGTPLGESTFGRTMLGVKCGCNDAFIVDAIGESGDHINVACGGRQGLIERDVLRPLLRGDSVTAWTIPPSRDAIVWTHGSHGTPIRALPSGAAKWLGPWRRQLTARTDLRGSATWWSLFRTESADSTRPRIVWSDFGRTPRAALLGAGDGTVPLNSCYVLSCDDVQDALAFMVLLNSPVAAAWLNAIAEPARGGWHRYLAWTVSLLPLPRDWVRARSILVPLAERALLGKIPTNDDLLNAVCKAYWVRVADITPLIAWCHSPTST